MPNTRKFTPQSTRLPVPAAHLPEAQEAQVKASFTWQRYLGVLAVLSEGSSGESAPCSLPFLPKSLHLRSPLFKTLKLGFKKNAQGIREGLGDS